jgi:hypothetical protein
MAVLQDRHRARVRYMVRRGEHMAGEVDSRQPAYDRLVRPPRHEMLEAGSEMTTNQPGDETTTVWRQHKETGFRTQAHDYTFTARPRHYQSKANKR